MTDDELALIQSKHNAAIIAPAGHGKTEMITELVERLPGKKLVLTHTNAGISVLVERLNRKSISTEKYSISTISSFCMKWCDAYPMRAKIDRTLSVADKGFFDNQYAGTRSLFSQTWAREVLQKTYSCVIVDEYQDCIIEQHRIFLEINNALPVYILGDPLQSIFGWAGKPVSWQNLEFDIVSVVTEPHRWKKSNVELGNYLSEIRKIFMPALYGKTVTYTLPTGCPFINVLSPASIRDPAFFQEIRHYQSVLYLTKWPQTQCNFAQQTAGLFQNDESQSIKELYQISEQLDTGNGFMRAKNVIEFAEICATKIKSELGSYKDHVSKQNDDFTRIRKYQEFGIRIKKLCNDNTLDDILSVLDWIRKMPDFKLYREELFFELMRAIKFAKARNASILDAAQQIRMIPNNQNRYSNFRRLSSRTVLSKGLEFECVIIDLSDRYTVTEMYVAMTRAMKKIIFLSNNKKVCLCAPQL